MNPHLIHADITRFRFGIAFCILASTLFMLGSMGSHGGWATGTITTKTSYRTSPASNCPDSVNATCRVEETTSSTITTDLNYGLFRDIIYSISSEEHVIQEIYQTFPNGTERFLDRHDEEKDQHNDVLQHDYSQWAKGNGRAMNNVRGAQGCLIIAWFLTLISWAMLVQALHFTTTKKAAESKIKQGFYLLLSSSMFILLSYAIWSGLSNHALTYMCMDDPQGRGISVCKQLQTITCNTLKAEIPGAACSTDVEIQKCAGLWGLTFFTWMLQILALLLWRRLYSAVIFADEDESSTTDEATSGDAVLPPYTAEGRKAPVSAAHLA